MSCFSCFPKRDFLRQRDQFFPFFVGFLEQNAKEATKLELNRDLKQCLARHDGSNSSDSV